MMLAARLTERPVVWHGTRSESFLTDIQGRGVRVRGRLAVDAAGRFTALSMEYDAIWARISRRSACSPTSTIRCSR